MQHEYSILYKLINGLLLKILGEPSEWYLHKFGAQHGEVFWIPDPVIMALFAIVLLLAILVPISRRLSVDTPSTGQQVLELLVSGLGGLIDDVVGHGMAKRFLPIIGGFAMFIFTCNIFGLFFFLQPPTANTSTTFALSITAFIYYNVVGIRENGLLNYLKHFMGPMPALAILMVPIELISHAARMLSLSLRLFGNISGEHTATAIFFGLFPLFLPWPMMALGIFGALLQAFIFIMLTMAYLQGAVGAEEH